MKEIEYLNAIYNFIKTKSPQYIEEEMKKIKVVINKKYFMNYVNIKQIKLMLNILF